MGLCHLLPCRAHRGTDKGVFIREALRTGLELRGSIDNGVGVLVVLDQVQDAFHRVAGGLQAAHILIDFGHGSEKGQQLAEALLHDFGRFLIEGKGCGGGNKGDTQLQGHGLAPGGHGVSHDTIRLPGRHIPADHVVEGQGGLHQHMGGEGQVCADALPILGRQAQLGIIGVTGDKVRPGGLNHRPEGFIGIILHLMAPAHQLPHHPQGGIGVAVGGDAEKDDLTHVPPPVLPRSAPQKSWRCSGSSCPWAG